MHDFDSDDFQELETQEGYFRPYCRGCDTTFLFWWKQYMGDSDSEVLVCPNCSQVLGNIESEFRLLGQLKGDVGEEVFKFKLAEPKQPKLQIIPEEVKRTRRKFKLPNDDNNPSEVTESPWIHAYREVGTYPGPTRNNGKWLIFVLFKNVDRAWAIVKQATEQGKLGEISKVSTASNNDSQPHKKVICVYTYDWTDEEDVKRIREELRKLGVTRKIAYKSDDDTRSGKYKRTGHTRISKYYE